MYSKRDKNKFLECLRTIPLISKACNKCGIERTAIYRWKKKDKDFSKKLDIAINDGRESMSEMAESQLFKKIAEGDFKAISFYLQNNNRRYVKPRPINYFGNVLEKKPENNVIVFKEMDVLESSTTGTEGSKFETEKMKEDLQENQKTQDNSHLNPAKQNNSPDNNI